MNTIQQALRGLAFPLLFNATLQIALLAIVTALFSRLIAKARAKHQHAIYSAAFFFCLATPLINTLWPSHPVAPATNAIPQLLPPTAASNQGFWPWQNHSGQPELFTIQPQLQSLVIALWTLFIVYRLIHFTRGLHRVRRLRAEASVLPLSVLGMASQIIDTRYNVALLTSPTIDDPVTIGVLHPAIVLPSQLLPNLSEQDLAAILAHEFGHIHRKDFLLNILCELLSLPFAWHPGIRYLMPRLSATRELACDDYAALRLGHRGLYARTLLRLASLCLHTSRGNTLALGIFNGDDPATRNLENRIMMLTHKRLSLSPAGVLGLTLAISLPFAASTVLAHAMSLQAGSQPANAAQAFTGTWHWIFNGKSFATMTFAQDGSSITGSVTESRINLNTDGELSSADPADDTAPKPITRATLDGSTLHVTVSGGFEFTVTLKDQTHAEIHPVGAPPNMKPIPAEKAH